MKHKDLVNINRVIEFIHEYKDCGLQETGLLIYSYKKRKSTTDRKYKRQGPTLE